MAALRILARVGFFSIFLLVAFWPIGSSTQIVDNEFVDRKWSLLTLVIGLVVSGGPLHLNRYSIPLLAVAAAGMAVVLFARALPSSS